MALEGSASSLYRASGGLSAGRPHQFGGSASGTSCASLASAKTSSRMTRSVTSVMKIGPQGTIKLAEAMIGTMTGFYDRMHIDDP